MLLCLFLYFCMLALKLLSEEEPGELPCFFSAQTIRSFGVFGSCS